MAEVRTPSSGAFLDPGSLKRTHQDPYTGSTLHEDDPFFKQFAQDAAAASSASTTPPTAEVKPTPAPRPSRKFPRISIPIELMRSSYDVVVIGTGYGGGVAASRMARGRQSVCVLERGLERWPGEFPEQLTDAAKEIRISGEFAPGDRRSIPGKVVGGGNPTGLYHFMMGDGQNAFVGNGLGGGSLVNANVFLEATPEVLDMEVWPEELRGKEKWRKYYDRAMGVLEPEEYPSSYPKLAKAELLKKQAERLGLQDNFYHVKQTTRFHDGPNSTGVPMKASTLTGMDATGINDGSKSTTLVNYLSDAWNWGAEMFCECEVRHVAKAEDREGYIVYFSWHGSKRDRFEGFQEDLMWVHAKKFVFFGAGSLGTTEILLRSKQFGLSLSDELGAEMSGNGDMLGFGYNTDYDANCIAQPVTDPERPVGPCITSVLDMRKQDNPLSGFVVEDCAVPYALSALMYPMLEFLPDPNKPDYGATEAAAKKAARVVSRLFGAHNVKGSVAKTAVYLIMSHDSSQGSLTLRHDKPILTYSGVGRSDSVSQIHEFLEKMTAAIGGNFIANPAWTALGAQQITVHAIGGARISADGTGKKGVVNHTGEVFTGKGSGTHSGLVVCDGSMVPAAVGVNPFASITALAERSVEIMAQKYDIVIDYETKNGILDMFGSPAHPMPRDEPMVALEETLLGAERDSNRTLGFSEVMAGFIHAGPDIGDFEAATKLAKSQCEAARVFLDVKSWQVTDLLNDDEHPAHLTGTFMCNALGGTFSVTNGKFQLFIKYDSEPEARNMVYDFDMESTGGRKLHFRGVKVLNSAVFLRPWRLWGQTTTLYVTITDTLGNVVGRGTLYVYLRDFLRQIQTFEIQAPSWWRKIGVAVGFGGFFAGQTIRPLLSTLGRLQWPKPVINTGFEGQQPSQRFELTASDGVKTTMIMWNPFDKQGDETESPMPTILFIPGAAVDHTIFALPTIKHNAISFFRKAGYRSYCITHRVGRTPEARNGHTPYDARLDMHAALAKIREVESLRSGQQPEKIYIVAHCAGSLALSCGLLDGTIPGDWIKGITASMVFMNPKFGKINNLLSVFPTNLYSKLISPWWDCTSTPDDTLVQRIVNQALRLYPVGSARETCQSVVCHRSSLAFGRLWTHANLNEDTHVNLEHFLGGTSMRSLGWLMKAGSEEHVTTNEPSRESLVTPENIERLKGIPILFFSGTGNMVFTAENTDRSYTTLCRAHGRQWYQREVFQGKGHLDAWMSSSAHEDVYPRVLSHVEEVMGMS